MRFGGILDRTLLEDLKYHGQLSSWLKGAQEQCERSMICKALEAAD